LQIAFGQVEIFARDKLAGGNFANGFSNRFSLFAAELMTLK
jgi:hypothetical protein